ncbi:MAG: molecular chaperone TorD family protein [Burkholderiales bacterium]|nr:molecular chaperone TorD family protein [Burkholderiales bacterium]
MNEPLPPSLLHERSEFYLTLARSFLTPLAEEHYRAMVDFLADDLADLDRSLGYGFTSEVASLRSAMAKVASHEELLVGYSSLFLQPPRAVALNVCAPLDGAVMGGTVSEIELFYRHYGVERSGHFKDLPDHLSVQLEFVSYLYGRAANSLEGEHPDLESEKAAGHFLHAFVSRWLPYFAAGIERAGNKLALQANPYGPLARILAIATARDAAANADWIKPRKRSEVAMDKARLRYAGREISPEDMADMERKLRGKGLGTGHLHVALADRNAAMGLSAKSPPDPRRR